ncbi:HNH endonuclease [Mucilaginibacter defluvii]|uniref:HNH endonuclease n=1 Tax=Mucilaginibacter defluvii TaxID=1196019 RepID=A0ABP9FGM1_9SPHI
MKAGQSLWTKDESILAVNLYCKIPFGQMHSGNASVIELAKIIGRTPSAVARKLGNFASFDPKLQARGVKGLENASKLDKEVWQEYMNNWDELFMESERLLAVKKGTTIEKLNNIDLDNLKAVDGLEKQRLINTRVNQSLFRRIVLTNFNNKCCITGINVPQLLVASHILPWSKDKENRLNPKNGLAFNALHDKAFDTGLITITEDLKIKVSSNFLKHKEIYSIKQNFIDYDGKSMLTPQKFLPDADFLKKHNDFFKI